MNYLYQGDIPKNIKFNVNQFQYDQIDHNKGKLNMRIEVDNYDISAELRDVLEKKASNFEIKKYKEDKIAGSKIVLVKLEAAHNIERK